MATSFFTSIANRNAQPNGRRSDPPNIEVPKAFGVTLLATEIKDNAVTFVWIFVNRTDAVVQVTWLENSHPFDVVIKNGKGRSWHINDFMGPAPQTSAPVSIQPNSESARVLLFQPSQIPNLDLTFARDDEPYEVVLKLNSDSHRFSAVTGLKFAS